MADAYRRSGRGGAGNFYSQKDVADIERRAAESSKSDLEAQKPPHPAAPPRDGAAPSATATAAATTTATAGAYARSGRGGAGNFVDASTATTTTASPETETSTATAPPRAGHSGRGGAGNWTTATSDGGDDGAEREKRRREALDRVIKDSLPRQPPRTYHLHGGMARERVGMKGPEGRTG